MAERELIVVWVGAALAKTGGMAKTARALGLSERVVYAWRAGARCPTLDNAMRLAALSGVPLPTVPDDDPIYRGGRSE